MPATNTKGSRVKIWSHRFHQGITIPYNYSLNNISEMACEYLESKGFEIVGRGEATKFDVIVSNTFKPLK